jgi:hypothetical protein
MVIRAHDLASQFMDKEIIVDGLILEDFILLQEALRDTKLPVGDLQKYAHLTDLLHKVNTIVQALEE